MTLCWGILKGLTTCVSNWEQTWISGRSTPWFQLWTSVHWFQCWSHRGWYGLIWFMKLVAATTTLQTANQLKKYLVCIKISVYQYSIYIYKMGWLLSIDRRVCAYFYFWHYYPILYLTVTAQSIPFLICIFLVNYKQQLLLHLCQNLLHACATIRLPVLYFPNPSTHIYYGSAAVILCCFGVYQKWTCQKNIYVTWSYRCGLL